MKKIGILTMHRVVNYGSFLQAYALKQIIRTLVDSEVTFIDIKPGRKILQRTPFARLIDLIHSFIGGHFFDKIYTRNFNSMLKTRFEKTTIPLLGRISDSDHDAFDTVVIGSDEVFHCIQNSSWGFTKQLYGDIANTQRVISYAASFGATIIEDIKKYNLQNDIRAGLLNMAAISVRDDNSFSIINEITGKVPVISLDPVLLYGYKKEMSLCEDFSLKDNYLLVYSYNGRICDNSEISEILSIARKNNLRIYTVFCRYKWADDFIIPNTPFDLLKVFQKAKYVISDTFHGTIFSIITHSRFCTLLRSSNRLKLQSLLSVLDLSLQAVDDPSLMYSVLSNNISYFQIENNLDKLREESLKYLKENL